MSHCADLPTLVFPSKAQVSVEGLGRAGGVGGGQRRGCLGKFSYLGRILLSLTGASSLRFRLDPEALLQSLTYK